ncbi:MAG TPA: cytochrome c-type biogenesis protein [Gemmatimonadaceae bacterium]|nr:cytochrome c-type biogenesis protein [Gemmatimonadaceae bacterium]
MIGFARGSLVLLAALVMAGGAGAQSADTAALPASVQAVDDSALEARTSEVASKLRCPVCQGESIQDSPASLAREMRGVVKDRLRAGESPEQIKAYFVGRYGEWILLEPTTKGLNFALYLLPVVLVIGGLALVVVLVRRWTRPSPEAPIRADQP